MGIRLLVRQRSEEGRAGESRELLLHEPVVTLGRDKACQVVLPLQAVSRSHARISQDGALFFLEDLGSVYGTQINGQSLPKGEKRLLRDGDVIAIAQFDLSFERLSDVPQDHTSMMARHMVKNAMRALGSGEGPYLRIMNGPAEGKHISLPDAQEIVLGREEDVEVVLQDDLVSRRHAKVRRDWAGTHIEDLGSRNGIRVNRKRVSRKTLTDRDEIEIGGVKLLYLDPTEVQETRPPPVLDEDEGEDTPPPAQPPASADEEEEPSAEQEADEPSEAAEDEEASEASEAEEGPEPEEEPEAPAEPSHGSMPVAALDAEGAGPDLAGLDGHDEPSDELAEDDEALDPSPPEVRIQHWIVLGAAGLAALLVLGLVLLVLVGA
jgi:pSer/pThr/pTyr-binding forkhead associated (FHA) protein